MTEGGNGAAKVIATILPPLAVTTLTVISKAYAAESLQRLLGAAMMVGAVPYRL